MNIKGQGHPITLVQGHSDSTFSNFFSLETTGRIEAKFHVKPVYGKNIKKSFSPEPKGQWPWMLVCSIGYSSTTKLVQMMTLGWPWPILRQGQI